MPLHRIFRSEAFSLNIVYAKMNRIIPLGFLLFLFFSCREKGGITNTDKNLQQILANADSLKAKEDYKGQVELLQKAMPLLRQYDDSLACWLRVGRDVAATMASQLGHKADALTFLDNVYQQLGEWRPTKDSLEHIYLTYLYFRDLRITLDISNLDRLKSVLDKVEPIFREHISGKNDDVAAYFFKETANLYVRMGEFTTASQYFEESKNYIRRNGQAGVANYNDYGSSFLTQGDYQKALGIFTEGLKTWNADYYNQTLLVLNQAEALARLGKIDEAIAKNNQALEMTLDTANYTVLRLNRCRTGFWENRGIIAQMSKDWNEVIRYFNQTITSDASKNLQRREKAASMVNVGDAYFELQQYDTALSKYHQAYLYFYPASKEAVTSVPVDSNLLTDKILADVLEGKARCFEKLHNYDLALAMYELIPTIEAQLRATHTFENSTLKSLQKSRKRLDHAVELAWKAWQETHNPVYAQKAFWFTETARGVLQTQGILANDAYSNLNDSQKKKDKALATRLAALETELAETDDNTDGRMSGLMQEIRDVKKEQKTFRTSLMKGNATYASEMDDQKNCTLQDVSRLLLEGQTLFDFYLADSAALHVFVADCKGNISWRRTEWTADHQKMLENVVLTIRIQDGPDTIGNLMAADAFKMFQTLMQPEIQSGASGMSNICMGNAAPVVDSGLVIVPDMGLTSLPFEALLTASTDGKSKWGNLPYLIRKFSVGYAYSCSLLELQQKITKKHAKNPPRMPYAGFAPAYKNPVLKLDSASTDVLYGKMLHGGEAYLDSAANETQFRAIAEDAQILLLSMHGVSDHKRPLLSKLYLGDSLSTPTNKDNVLMAGELQNIPCRADMAVLSACFTGDGPLEMGEGVYSLARAFTISGVPSSAVSLWPFSTYSSSMIVRGLMKGVKGHQRKDIALRNGKLEYLAEENATSKARPFYWACFIAAGDMAPLESTRPSFRMYAFVAGVILLGGIWYFFRRK